MNHNPVTRRSIVKLLGAAGAVAAAGSAGVLRAVSAAAAIPGPASYSATWASVDQHPPAPEWFQDAKFGIYYHWGAFSVPAFGNEWYPRNMYNNGSAENNHHKSVYGDPSVWPYHNFINGARDRAGNFVQFAPKLASAGGALRPRRVGAAVRRRGRQVRRSGRRAPRRVLDVEQQRQRVELGRPRTAAGPAAACTPTPSAARASSSWSRCTTRTTSPATTSSCRRSPTRACRKLYGQLGTAGGVPALVRQAEGGHRRLPARHPVAGLQPGRRSPESYRLNFLSYYYNRAVAWNKEVVATYKDGFNNRGEVFDFERGGPAGLQTPYWLTDDSISSSSWCYTVGIGYYSHQAMLHSLIDRVSKNGNMVLNIAPMADGTIPSGQQQHPARHRRLSAAASASPSTPPAPGQSTARARPRWAAARSAPRAPAPPRTSGSPAARTTGSCTPPLLGWPGSTADHHHAELEPDQPQHPDLGAAARLHRRHLHRPARPHPGRRRPARDPALRPPPYSALAYVLKLTFSGPIPALGGGGPAHRLGADRQRHHRSGPGQRRQRRLRLEPQAVELGRQHQPAVAVRRPGRRLVPHRQPHQRHGRRQLGQRRQRRPRPAGALERRQQPAVAAQQHGQRPLPDHQPRHRHRPWTATGNTTAGSVTGMWAPNTSTNNQWTITAS